MKTMKLLPLKIAVTSAMIIGLGAASTANAQAQSGTLTYLEQARNLIDYQYNNYKGLKGLDLNGLKNVPDLNELKKKGRELNRELNEFKTDTFTSQQLHVAAMEELNEGIEDLYGVTEHLHEVTEELDEHVEDLYEITNENLDRISQLDGVVSKNTQNIQDLAKAQLAGVTVMEELDKKSDENAQKLKNLQGIQAIAQRSIGANTIDINKNKESIAKNNDAIDDLYEANEENVERIVTIDYATAANRENIQQNNEAIEDLYGFDQEVADRIQKIDEHNEQQNDTISKLITESINNTKRVTDTELSINENKADIQKNTNAVQSLKDLYTVGIRTVEKNEKAIKEHQKLIADNKADIAANKADADAKFVGVQTDIANNKTTLAEHAKKINDNQQAIEAKLGGKADLQKLSELKTSVDKNQANIKTLAEVQLESATFLGEQIQENKDDIAKNNESIEDLYEANNENVERLTQVDNNVLVNRLNIKELERKQENDIKDVIGMQNAIAEQADKNQADIAANKADANAKFKGVQTDIANNKITLAEHAKKIDDNQQAIEAKLGGKADLQKLAELKTSVDKNQAGIQLHDQKINNLGILHTMVARAVGNNTQGVATNKADIAKNNESIEDLYEANAENVERLTQVDNNVFVNRLNIQELKRKQENDIKDVVGMQNAIAEQADKNKNHIQDLAKAQLAGVEVMDELNKNVEANKSDIQDLAKAQDAGVEVMKELNKNVEENKAGIAANKADADAKFKGVQTDIANNKTTLAQHAKKIDDNQKAIEAKLGGKADTQVLTDLNNKVDGFDGRISALDTKVNAFDGRITALDSKVENGMAAQAALSGLFQPYSVGKFNATAALGGYGSKSAVAIGAGYRVNPNLAFKAGAAINTSGDKKGSYNIGVNYEF